MGDVIELNKYKQNKSRKVVCLHCRHKWFIASSESNDAHDCPECGLSMGIFADASAPEDRKLLTCYCGNIYLLFVEGYEIYCPNCGDYIYESECSWS